MYAIARVFKLGLNINYNFVGEFTFSQQKFNWLTIVAPWKC